LELTVPFVLEETKDDPDPVNGSLDEVSKDPTLNSREFLVRGVFGEDGVNLSELVLQTWIEVKGDSGSNDPMKRNEKTSSIEKDVSEEL
jgi:hypothetical protein